MNARFNFFAAIAALLMVSCGQNDTSTKSPPATNTTSTTSAGTKPLDAPAGYLKALANGQQSAVKTVDTTSLDKAIQLFNIDQGRNPKDLDELVQKKYIPKMPEPPYGMKIVYDQGSGSVKVVKQ